MVERCGRIRRERLVGNETCLPERCEGSELSSYANNRWRHSSNVAAGA